MESVRRVQIQSVTFTLELLLLGKVWTGLFTQRLYTEYTRLSTLGVATNLRRKNFNCEDYKKPFFPIMQGDSQKINKRNILHVMIDYIWKGN